MSAVQLRIELAALLDELAGIDLTPQDRHALTVRILRMMQD